MELLELEKLCYHERLLERQGRHSFTALGHRSTNNMLE